MEHLANKTVRLTCKTAARPKKMWFNGWAAPFCGCVAAVYSAAPCSNSGAPWPSLRWFIGDFTLRLYLPILWIEFVSKLSRRSVSPSTYHKFESSLLVNCHDRRYYRWPTMSWIEFDGDSDGCDNLLTNSIQYIESSLAVIPMVVTVNWQTRFNVWSVPS